MTTQTAAVQDPAQCERDHLLWLEEIEQWKSDHERALRTLDEVSIFVRQHEAELDGHLADIERHRGQMGDGEVPVATQVRHGEVRERHNRLRGRHRGMMDEITRLAVSLHKAAHGEIL